MKKERNIAFIDGQNLHLWTTSENWKIDFKRFRVYLKDKFKVDEAYFFLWFLDEFQQELYTNVQKAWFIVEFREHNSHMKWTKKWNVDVDIVFEIMKRLIEENDFDKIVLITWDWDYIKMIKYLIQKKRLKKILFPNKKYSSLYKKLQNEFWMNLSQDRVKSVLKFRQ
jgi:uncharacterized LabA/DUF88 family protein